MPRSGQVVVSSGRPSVRPSACSHWVPLRVAPSSNLLSSPPASVRRADYFRPPRSAQTPAECFLSVRFAPDFLMLRSSIFVRSASSCALADSVRPALVPRSTRTVSAAAPAFASLTTSKRCARPSSARADPLPPETTTCPALVPRSGQVVVSSGRPSARPSACSHQFRSAWRPPVICSPILLRRSGEQITSVRPAPLKLLRSVFYPFASLRIF